MSKSIKTQIGKIVGSTLNTYYQRVKPTIDDLRYRQEYQDRIIKCMVEEVDDNYITTPETDNPIVKLEHSKEGLVKVPTVKGKTILVDADGNETDTPAEGCKLLSVGEQEDNKMIILSKNKNLFDFDNMYEQYGNYHNDVREFKGVKTIIGNNEYTISACKNSWYSQGIFSTPIYLKKGETLNFSGSAKDISNVAIFNINDFMTPYSATSSFNETYKDFSIKHIAQFDGYYVARYWIPYEKNGCIKNIQIEKSISKTSYVEPKHHKTEILLDEPLRSLPNGVCDEIVGNKIVRRVGKMIIDGNLHWGAFQDYDLTYKFGMGISHSVIKSTTLMADNIRYVQQLKLEEEGSKTQICIYNHQTQKEIRVAFLKSDYPMITNQPKSVQDYFKENPLLLLYELAEPIIEELPNGITLQGFDDTTMYIENSITPTVSYGYNALIPYKEELSNQKEEVEVNTLDIENNIIPYLMDIEFNLMTMEDNE